MKDESIKVNKKLFKSRPWKICQHVMESVKAGHGGYETRSWRVYKSRSWRTEEQAIEGIRPGHGGYKSRSWRT